MKYLPLSPGVVAAAVITVLMALFAAPALIAQPVYYSDDADLGVAVIDNHDGSAATFELWTASPDQPALCTPDGSAVQCEAVFGSGFRLRIAGSAIQRSSRDGVETFEEQRGRYLSVVSDGVIHELTRGEGSAAGFTVQVVEWSRREATPIDPAGDGEYTAEIDGVRLELQMDATRIVYTVFYPDGDEETLAFTSMDGRGASLAAVLPEARLLPDFSRPAGGDRSRIAFPPRAVSRREITLPENTIPLAISPDGRSLIVGDGADSQSVVDLRDGAVRSLPIEGRIVPELLAWSPSGRFVTWVDGASMGSDVDLSVTDLERSRTHVLLNDDYDGSSWDLPDGVFTDDRSLWIDDRRILVARRGNEFGTSLWMVEVDDPTEWTDGEADATELLGAGDIGAFELSDFDRPTGRVILRSIEPLSVSDAAHPFAIIRPGEAIPEPLPPAATDGALFVRSTVTPVTVVPGGDALVVVPPREVVEDEVGPEQPPVLLRREPAALFSMLPMSTEGAILDVAAAPAGDAIAIVHADDRTGGVLVSIRRLRDGVPQGPLMTVFRGAPGAPYPSWRPSFGRPLIRWTSDHRLVFVADEEGSVVELTLRVSEDRY